jgi:hypothetical protein
MLRVVPAALPHQPTQQAVAPARTLFIPPGWKGRANGGAGFIAYPGATRAQLLEVAAWVVAEAEGRE